MSARTKTLIQIGVSLAIVTVLYYRLDWAEAQALVRGANPFLLAVPVVVSAVDRVWMAWKWRLLLAVLCRPPSVLEAIRVYYVSSFQGVALPLGGLGPDILRYFHLRSHGVSAHAVTVSIVIERILGLVATIVAGVIGLIALQRELGADAGVPGGLMWLLLALLGASIAFFLSLFHDRSRPRIYRVLGLRPARGRLGRHPAAQKVVEAIERFRSVPGRVVANLLLSITEQLFSVISLYVAALALRIPLTITQCLAVAPLTVLAQRIPIGYAGIGIREGALVVLLGLFGVAYADIIVLSSALLLTFLVSLLPGAVWSLGLGRVGQPGAKLVVEPTRQVGEQP